MPIGKILKSVGSALGSVFTPGVSSALGAGLSYLGGKETRDQQLGLYQDQKSWLTQMSNTAYQRAMADMKKAGLNPILAGKLGGASTPGLNMPQLHDYVGPAVNTAFTGMQSMSQAEAQQEQANLSERQQEVAIQQAEKISADTVVANVQADVLRKELEKKTAEINKIAAETSWREAMSSIVELAEDAINALRDVSNIHDEQSFKRQVIDALKELGKLGPMSRFNNSKSGSF